MIIASLSPFITDPSTRKSSFDIGWWVSWKIIFPHTAPLRLSLRQQIISFIALTICNDLCVYLLFFLFHSYVCTPNIRHMVDTQEILVGSLGIPKVKLSNCQSLSHPLFCSGYYYTISRFLLSRKSFPLPKTAFLASISMFPNHS